jgi:UDP-N-acetylmuramate: L-alanyl-gamma-D-glutamyl-meso-diaminopimelate ligase
VSAPLPRRIHFVAIGGTGMGSLAGLLHARGVAVSGSDEKLYPPMSTQLQRWGIPVRQGFRAEHVSDARPDLVVIGNVVRKDNPEARAALDGGYRCVSFSDALYELAMAGRHSLVVTGTHGKTTTTALLASILVECGHDPGVLVAGVAENLDGSFRIGEGPEFVVEGDEYDTVFFDKTPKFLHYHADTAILTSVEFDHADIYRDLDHVKQAFRLLVEAMPADGLLIAATGLAHVADVVSGAPCALEGYAVEGEDADARWWARDLAADADGTRFSVHCDGRPLAGARLALWGRHNVANALAAVAAACARGVAPEAAAAALETFRGVQRRQQIRGEAGGVTLLDDFAHHPTAVRETLAAMRERFRGRRLWALFEPRTNTSRRRIFQEEYAEALGGADRVVLARVADAPIYSITGEVSEHLDVDALADELAARGVPAQALEGADAIAAHVATEAQPGDVVVTMSNGDFGNIWPKLLTKLKGQSL